MPNAAFILLAYLIGSLPFAVIVSKALGLPDPRSYGSGNPGATNVLRTGRKLAALLTLAGDGGKGWLAVFLAARYGVDAIGVAACALAGAMRLQMRASQPRGYRFAIYPRWDLAAISTA